MLSMHHLIKHIAGQGRRGSRKDFACLVLAPHRDKPLAAHPKATRIRRSVEEITTSGLTLAKLTVAANSLGDLVKG
jgi:glutamate dehydrogenase